MVDRDSFVLASTSGSLRKTRDSVLVCSLVMAPCYGDGAGRGASQSCDLLRFPRGCPCKRTDFVRHPWYLCRGLRVFRHQAVKPATFSAGKPTATNSKPARFATSAGDSMPGRMRLGLSLWYRLRSDNRRLQGVGGSRHLSDGGFR